MCTLSLFPITKSPRILFYDYAAVIRHWLKVSLVLAPRHDQRSVTRGAMGMPFVQLSVSLSVHLSVSPSVRLSICPVIYFCFLCTRCTLDCYLQSKLSMVYKCMFTTCHCNAPRTREISNSLPEDSKFLCQCFWWCVVH